MVEFRLKILIFKANLIRYLKPFRQMLLEVLKTFDLKEKCIAFCGDNCNTNFGGIQTKGKQNVYAKLKENLTDQLIGVSCPGHIFNNTAREVIL